MQTPPPIEPGAELAGKYRIERVLAQGGMGVVVAARHLRLDERVAIKFLLPESLQNPEAFGRFEREARAAARIRSEHSVRVRDVGTLEWGAPYMVMEYLAGHDLSVELGRRQTIPLAETLDYLLQAGEAIAEAHHLGVVHRDLKPANLFLSHRADGSVCIKVLDFGISKLSSLSATQATPDYGMTQAATVLGSPYYMSPEQITSAREVDHRADVWALGVILYEMLCGLHPFEGDTMQGLAVAVVTQQPTPFPREGTGIAASVVEVIMACLEKNREQRIQSVAEFASRLRLFAPASAQLSIDRILRVSEGSSLSSFPPPDQAIQAAAVQSTVQRTHWGFSSTTSWASSRTRWLLVAAGGALSLGLAWSAVTLSHRDVAASSERASPGVPITTTTYVRSATQQPREPESMVFPLPPTGRAELREVARTPEVSTSPPQQANPPATKAAHRMAPSVLPPSVNSANNRPAAAPSAHTLTVQKTGSPLGGRL